MASRQQIDRLSQRIEELADRASRSGRIVPIIVDGESEESAIERHYLAHPQDLGLEVIILQIVDAKDGRPVKPQYRESCADGH